MAVYMAVGLSPRAAKLRPAQGCGGQGGVSRGPRGVAMARAEVSYPVGRCGSQSSDAAAGAEVPALREALPLQVKVAIAHARRDGGKAASAVLPRQGRSARPCRGQNGVAHNNMWCVATRSKAGALNGRPSGLLQPKGLHQKQKLAGLRTS